MLINLVELHLNLVFYMYINLFEFYFRILRSSINWINVFLWTVCDELN